MANLLQSGVASAERVFELLDAEEEPARAGRAAGRGRPRRGGLRARVVPLRRRPAADRGPVAGRAPGPDGRDRRADRRRQDDAGQPGDALLRGRRRPHHPRRRRHRDDAPRGPARPHRHGAAGHLAVRGHDPRQHRLRATRRDRGGDPRGGAGDVRRPVRAHPARRLRHRRRRGGQQHQRRRAAAGHDRAGVPGRPGAADPRRGHQLGRHPHRAAGPAGDGGAAHRPDVVRDRAPALHDPRRRPDPGDGGRRDRRAGHARGAARRRRCLRRALPLAVRGVGDRR